MKKGFTLIEIIISISLILIVGVSTTFFILNKKNNNELENIKNEIVDAVNLYINSEYDDDGILYINGIKSSRRGLYLTVNNLLEKGYLDEELVKTLEKNTNLDKNNLKVLASNSVYNNEDIECSEGLIQFEFNFDNVTNEPIYLCPTNNKITEVYSNNVSDYLISKSIYPSKVQMSTDLKTEFISNADISNYYKLLAITGDIEYGGETYIYETKYTGLKYRFENDKNLYYYRGINVNNYVEFSNSLCNFRIVSFTDDYIKIIPESYDLTECYYGNASSSNINFKNMFEDEWLLNDVVSDNLFYNTLIDTDKIKQHFYNLDFCLNPYCEGFYSSFIGPLTYEEAVYSGYSDGLNAKDYYPHFMDTGTKAGIIDNGSYLQNGNGSILSIPKKIRNYSLTALYGYFGETAGNGNKPLNYNGGDFRYYDTFYYRKASIDYGDEDLMRPVIVLKSDMWKITGNGTDEHPFVLKSILE